jgi:hypothetical protein
MAGEANAEQIEDLALVERGGGLGATGSGVSSSPMRSFSRTTARVSSESRWYTTS